MFAKKYSAFVESLSNVIQHTDGTHHCALSNVFDLGPVFHANLFDKNRVSYSTIEKKLTVVGFPMSN